MKGKKFLAGILSAIMVFGSMSFPTLAEDNETGGVLTEASSEDKYAGFTDFYAGVKDGTVKNVEAIVDESSSAEGYTVWTPGKAELGNGPLADAKFGEKDGKKLFVVWRYRNDNATPYVTKEVKIDGVTYQTVIDMSLSSSATGGFFTSQNTTQKAKIETGVTVKGADKFFYSNHGLKTLDLPTELISQLNLDSNLYWAYFNDASEQYESYTVGSVPTGYSSDRIVLQGANTKPRTLRYKTSANDTYASKNICAWFAIKVDPNGGSCENHTETYTAIESMGSNTTLNSTPAKEGFVFDGWTITNDDINKTVTLTAKWADAPCVHDFVEKIIEDSTCTKEGTKTLTCSKCQTVENVIIPKKDHIYTEEITKEATCTDAGSKKLTCKNCQATKTETIPALGHNFENGECTRCHITKAMEAKIGDRKYDTLKEAIAAANNGDTIVLLENIEKNECYKISRNITLELNGKNITASTYSIPNYGSIFLIAEGATVTVQDSTGGSVVTQKYGNTTSSAFYVLGTLNVKGGKYVGSGLYGAISCGGGILNVSDAELYGSYGNVSIIEDGATAVFENTVVNAAEDVDGIWVQNGGHATIKSGTYNATVYTYGKSSTLVIENGIFNKAAGNNDGKGSTDISGGLFAENVSKYVVSGYAVKPEGNMFRVVKAAAKVIDTAKTTGAEITLNNLEKHEKINALEDATYQVVVKTSPKTDADKANEAIKAGADTNSSKAMFDISIVKIDSDGTETTVKDVKNQQVTITLGETPKPESVKVYHVDGETGAAAKIDDITVSGNTVSFIAPSFSTYAVTYTANSLADADITKNIKVAFEPIAGTASYDIVLKATDGRKINRFMSADLTFETTLKEGAVNYTVTPAANINISDKGDGRYGFNMDGMNASGATGENITIGTVTFEGIGKVDFAVNTTVQTNIVNTAKTADNIVEYNTTSGNGTTTGKLDLEDKLENVELKAPVKKLTVNVTFNNSISDNEAAYQDMKAVISGGNLADDITFNFGKDDGAVKLADNVYSFTQELAKNTAYTVKVEGAGYRTARYTVNLNADKTLNFWNNVMDNAIEVELGNEAYKKNVTFLAGDIVKDNKINIYDLSAVVSYFGTDNLVTEHPEYAKYDLNRDGVIDSKDVAYVLVSWGK